MHSFECGEIHFTLTPDHKITYINKAMLLMLNAEGEHDGWVKALTIKPHFFLAEESIPSFEECCKQAAAKNTPVYFEHHLYDRNLCKIKAHGLISRIDSSDEFLMMEILDIDLNKDVQNRFFEAITHIYDDVFVINKSTATVNVIRNLGAIGFEGHEETHLWNFKDFLITRLIHPDDRKDYISFLRVLDSNTTFSSTIECRIQDNYGKARWLQMTTLYQRPNELLLCLSDISKTKDAAHMQQRLKIDSITHIMNRDAFERLCCSYHEKTSFESTYNVLLLIEIDHFDDYSLDAQDKILKRTGDLLKSGLGDNAVYARFGDKKFIVCFHDLNGKDNAKKAIDRLYKHLHSHNEGESMPGYSMGFAKCMHDPEKQYRSAYECANAALKDAVKSGGNTIRDYDLLSSHSHMPGLPRDIKIQTFGYFEVFVDGVPVLFKNKKAKELLAVLVDRRGGYISSGDIISCLWENESVNPTTNARCRKIVMLLKRTLAEYGIDYIVESADRQRRLISDAVDCDLFHFLAGEESYINNYDGVYMLNYSWSEWTASYLNNIKNPL